MNIGAVIDKPGSSSSNKLNSWRKMKPKWDKKKCKQCMACWWQCPDLAVPQKNNKRVETNLDFCKGCGICALACPYKAITMEPEEK